MTPIGYWTIFRELLWAASRAMIVVAFLKGLQLGLIFYTSGNSSGLFDAFGGAIGMTAIGYILALPIIALFVFVIGTPFVYWLIKKTGLNPYILTILGALNAKIFFSIVPSLMSKKEGAFLEHIQSLDLSIILAGVFTGFFLYRQLQKYQALKQEAFVKNSAHLEKNIETATTPPAPSSGSK